MIEIILECLPAAILTACLIYICVKSERKGYLFVLSLVYIVLSVAHKIVSLVWWQNIDEASMDAYNIIGAIVTLTNYTLVLLVFIHILKNGKKYGNKKAVYDTKEETGSGEQ